MFSTTTIESSTSRPSATTKPTIASWFSEKPSEVERGEPDRERQRDRDHHDAGGAQAERQQREQHERDGEREVALQPRQAAVRTFVRLVEAALEPDAGRQAALERGRRA